MLATGVSEFKFSDNIDLDSGLYDAKRYEKYSRIYDEKMFLRAEGFAVGLSSTGELTEAPAISMSAEDSRLLKRALFASAEVLSEGYLVE